MTITELLGFSASQWEAITEEELAQILAPHLQFSRPSQEKLLRNLQANSTKATKAKKPSKNALNDFIRLAQDYVSKNEKDN